MQTITATDSMNRAYRAAADKSAPQTFAKPGETQAAAVKRFMSALKREKALGRRTFPAFKPGMSTSEYVSLYEAFHSSQSGMKGRGHGFWSDLNCDPATLYAGESFDFAPIVEDVADDAPMLADLPELIEAPAAEPMPEPMPELAQADPVEAPAPVAPIVDADPCPPVGEMAQGVAVYRVIGLRESHDEWVCNEARDFVPNARQSAVIGAVQTALAEGLFYNSNVVPRCAELLAVGPEDRLIGAGKVVDGAFGMDVYYARQAIRAAAAHAAEDEAAARLAASPGMKLGAMIFNDGKLIRAIVVTLVEDGGRSITFEGSRGRSKVAGTNSAASIERALQRAAERSAERAERNKPAPVAAPEPIAAEPAHVAPDPVARTPAPGVGEIGTVEPTMPMLTAASVIATNAAADADGLDPGQRAASLRRSADRIEANAPAAGDIPAIYRLAADTLRELADTLPLPAGEMRNKASEPAQSIVPPGWPIAAPIILARHHLPTRWARGAGAAGRRSALPPTWLGADALRRPAARCGMAQAPPPAWGKCAPTANRNIERRTT